MSCKCSSLTCCASCTRVDRTALKDQIDIKVSTSLRNVCEEEHSEEHTQVVDSCDTQDARNYETPEANEYDFHSSGIIDMLEKLQKKLNAELHDAQEDENDAAHASSMKAQDLTKLVELLSTQFAGNLLDLCAVEKWDRNTRKPISTRTDQTNRTITFGVDTAACRTVVPGNHPAARGCRVHWDPGAGVPYFTAGKSVVWDEGRRLLVAKQATGEPVMIESRQATVRRPLMAVKPVTAQDWNLTIELEAPENAKQLTDNLKNVDKTTSNMAKEMVKGVPAGLGAVAMLRDLGVELTGDATVEMKADLQRQINALRLFPSQPQKKRTLLEKKFHSTG